MRSARHNRNKRNRKRAKRFNSLSQCVGSGLSCNTLFDGLNLLDGRTFFYSEEVKVNVSLFNRNNLLFKEYCGSTFSLVDNYEGAIHYLSDGQVAFIKVPRKICLRSVQKFGPADAEVLAQSMLGRKRTERGAAMSHTFDNGHMVQRGAVGIRLSPQFRSNEVLQKRFNHMLKRIDRACEGFFPRQLISKFCHLRDKLCPFPTLMKKGFSCSVSVAVDHISAVHVDKDFFFSYLTARSKFQEYIDWNSSFYAPAAYHFIFPTIGYSVSIRPGDILIFNPTIPHCCSHKHGCYIETPVYLASFYVKTGHVGGNNNSLPLTEEQMKILNNT